METLILPAQPDRLHQLSDRLEELLRTHDCPMRTVMQVQLAAEEIFINIAHYAYVPGTGDVEIDIALEDAPHCLQLTFRDRGVPFDPLQKQDVDTTLAAEDRRIGGLGIYLVKKNMDTVSYTYRDGHNCLTMSKSW